MRLLMPALLCDLGKSLPFPSLGRFLHLSDEPSDSRCLGSLVRMSGVLSPPPLGWMGDRTATQHAVSL